VGSIECKQANKIFSTEINNESRACYAHSLHGAATAGTASWLKRRSEFKTYVTARRKVSKANTPAPEVSFFPCRIQPPHNGLG